MDEQLQGIVLSTPLYPHVNASWVEQGGECPPSNPNQENHLVKHRASDGHEADELEYSTRMEEEMISVTSTTVSSCLESIASHDTLHGWLIRQRHLFAACTTCELPPCDIPCTEAIFVGWA